jgi:AraC-like DNA-binding protein
MMVYEYELRKNYKFKKAGEQRGKEFIAFSFRNLFPIPNEETKRIPSVQISSGDIDLELEIPAKIKLNTILIIIHIEQLKLILTKNRKNRLLQTIFSGDKPFLYEQLVSAEMQKVAGNIFEVHAPEALSDFYLKLRAEELIYLFFVELLKRENKHNYPINNTDVKKIYMIRNQIISDLSSPPNLSVLTNIGNMSESKMNRLFKQIFGYTIYNYYQLMRMQEAARLIKVERLTVSEVGYKMGFTNLSQFTRIFEQHVGMKPKKYSMLT